MDIVTIADRPDLAPTVAQWLWHAFWRHDGYSLQDTQAFVVSSVARNGPPQTFVLLADGEPVGTASLVNNDLDERPDLTPWLAGVFVIPAARGRGYATRLIAAVERACQDATIQTAWLYTNTAEPLYALAGWQSVETIEHKNSAPVTVMRKDFWPGEKDKS